MSKEIKLSDYEQPKYFIRSTNLEVEIDKTEVFVRTILRFEPNKNADGNLFLNGIDLELKSIKLNNEDFADYHLQELGLRLSNLPMESFTLETYVKINAYNNHSGEGLYPSGPHLCTQCEAEGFRRISYYLDRPDVMSVFTTKMIANKADYPVLLSNGNLVDSGDLENGKHFAVWEDPFKKPSYLFAMVAGDLGVVKDTFTTMSGREVALEIFVDKGNEDKCAHAMLSLKNSMKWDEETFGLEYDLDVYMIVAVDSFNMGAMENKGLNVFNSAYVLAKKETATDSDFQGIEGVIGHEYFHNWTGNRVTCRDWFQLTLKEGLTVFRDQEFSSDMLSRPVKRIEDVSLLHVHQFPEDAGPLSHPIKPKSFVEINNFYTATVYEKGAEVIRMIHTLLGKEKFRKGMDLYFERNDGKAVTTEDFVAAMSDASGINLDHFKVWYDQNGTPSVKVTTDFNKEEKKLTINFEQTVITNRDDYDCLHFPFHFSLYSKEGKKIKHDYENLELNQKVQSVIIDGLDEHPVLSLNENYTAPVKVFYKQTPKEFALLMGHCQDPFNQYHAAQELIEYEISQIKEMIKAEADPRVSKDFINAYKALLMNNHIDGAFKTFALSIPTTAQLNNKSDKFDFDVLPKAIKFLKVELAKELYDEFSKTLGDNRIGGEFSVDAKSMGKRALRNFCLKMMFSHNSPEILDLVYGQFQNATNMTDEISALNLLAYSENPYREKALEKFYAKWKHETLVMQKWFAAQAMASDTGVEVLKKLEADDVYDAKVPNILRSVFRTFCRSQDNLFHAEDGSSYTYIAQKIKEVDSFNPQIAAGLCKTLNFLGKLEGKRKENLKLALKDILSKENLSTDVEEVARKSLEL